MRIMVKSKMADKLKKEGLHTDKTDVDIDPKELKMGIRVEMEHTDDPDVAREIALDHLAEGKAYYSHLAEMEGNVKKSRIMLKAKYTKRWKGKDGKWRYEYAKASDRRIYDVEESKKTASLVKKMIAAKGYEIEKSSFSHTSFGDSYYLTAVKDGVRVESRISDHGTGAIRTHEYDFHGDIRDTPESIVNKFDQAFKKTKEREARGKEKREERARKENMAIEAIARKVQSGELSKTAVRKRAKELVSKEMGELATYTDEQYARRIISGLRKSIGFADKMKRLMIRRDPNGIEEPKIATLSQLKKLAQDTPEYDRRYKLHGYKTIQGLRIAIENAKGTFREGKDPDGKPWRTEMLSDYGRIVGTQATDSEAVDAYIGPDETSKTVYVVHQNDPFTGKYDEDKCMIGYPCRDAAVCAYLVQYDKPDYLGPVSAFTMDEFKEALKGRRGGMLYRSPVMHKSRIMIRKM